MKLLISVIKAILILFGFIFITAIFSANSDNKKTEEELEKRAKVAELDPDKQLFMDGCVGEEANYTYCECTYDYLEDEYGKEGIVELAGEYLSTDEVPDEMLDAIKACLPFLK